MGSIPRPVAILFDIEREVCKVIKVLHAEAAYIRCIVLRNLPMIRCHDVMYANSIHESQYQHRPRRQEGRSSSIQTKTCPRKCVSAAARDQFTDHSLEEIS